MELEGVVSDMFAKEQELQKYIEKANAYRREWAQNDALRDAGVKEPEGVKQLTDIAYASSETEDEKRWHRMDIYYPVEAGIQAGETCRTGKAINGKYPVIISVHGGGWFYGDKELYKLYTMKLATYGFAVVNFNYRLSPEYPYPAGFQDVCSLVDYLNRHTEEYSLDMERLYMVGDSAGAQLVSQYCIYATNEQYRALFAFGENVLPAIPRKIALNCGVYDLGALFGENEQCDWYVPFYMERNIAVSFFKLFDYMTKEFPKTYLMLSVNDNLAKHTVPMKNKLQELNIPFVYREFGEDEPGDGHVFHLNFKSKNGERANREEIEFFSEIS